MDVSITDIYFYLLFIFLSIFITTCLILAGYSMTRQKIDITKYIVEETLENTVTVDGTLKVGNTLEVDSTSIINGSTTIGNLLSANELVSKNAIIIGNQIITPDDLSSFVSITKWVQISLIPSFTFPVPGNLEQSVIQVDTSQIPNNFLVTGTQKNLFTYQSNIIEKTLCLFTLDPGVYFISLNCLGEMTTLVENDDYTLTAQLIAYDNECVYYNIEKITNYKSNIIDFSSINLKTGLGFSLNSSAPFPYRISQSENLIPITTVTNFGLQFIITYSEINQAALSNFEFSKLELSVYSLI
jgi:hypothetical protein